MTVATQKICKGCGKSLPIDRNFFGSTPTGGFRGKCRACMAAHTKLYDDANRDSVIERSLARQARSSAAGPKWENYDVLAMRKAQRDLCAYCCVDLSGGGEVDHMVPLVKGGTNSFRNLVLACMQCNREKHAKTVDEYFAWRKRRNLPISKRAYAFRRFFNG